MDKTGVQAAFVAAGLSRLLKDIDLVTRASIRLYTTPVTESTLSVGTSKLGGVPDLPPEVSWPERKDLPQSFIAQIHLNDVRPYDANKALPQDGMLWFFYDAQQECVVVGPGGAGEVEGGVRYRPVPERSVHSHADRSAETQPQS